MARPGCGTRRLICALLATGLASALMPTPARAQSPEKKARLPQGLPSLPSVEERMASHELSGIALHGFDPVSFHLPGKPLGGLPEHEATHAGVVWRFATAANREAFLAAPETYMPAFEGHDAEGIARGRLVDTDPAFPALIGGRLHLFKSEENRGRYLSDPELARKAAAHWPELRRQLGR